MTHSSRVKHISFPAQMQDHFTSSGKRSERNTLNVLCIERISFASPGMGHCPSFLALGATQRFVYRELTDGVIIVVVIVELELSCFQHVTEQIR